MRKSPFYAYLRGIETVQIGLSGETTCKNSVFDNEQITKEFRSPVNLSILYPAIYHHIEAQNF